MASFLMQQQQLNSNSNSNSNVGGNNSNMWSNNNNYSYNNSGFVAVPPHGLRQAQFRMPTVDELKEEQLKAVANNALTSAICSYVPSVSDTSFVPALTKALEGSVVVTAAIYLRRLVAALTAVNIQAITQDAAQRLTLAVLVVGAKFVMDSPPSNAQWAKYNGVYDLATVTAMETEVLNHLNWRLAVSAVEYSTTVENLIGQWAPVDWATVSYNVHTSATSPAPVVSPVSPLPSPPSPGSNSNNSSSSSSNNNSSSGGASTYNSSTSYNGYNNNNNNNNNCETATPARISRRPPPLVLPNSIASGGGVGGGGGGNGSVADSNNVAGEYDSPIISYTPDAIAAVLATPTSADRSAWGAARSSSSGASGVSGVSGVSGAYITPGYNYYGSGSTTVTTTSASTTGVTTAPGFYCNPYSGSFGNGNGTSAVTATTTTTSGGGRGGGDVGQPQGVYADLYCSEDVSMSP